MEKPTARMSTCPLPLAPSRRTFIGLGVLVLLAGAPAEAAKQAKAPTPAASSEEAVHLTPATGVDQEASTFQLSGYREDGQKKWEVSGDTANVLEDTVKMTNIVAHSYGPQATVKLTADHGVLHRASQDVHLEDHVVATTDDGARMRTHELDWHQQEEKVTTPAQVWVARENIEVTGTGAVAHPNLKQVALEKDVTVVMTPKPEDAAAPAKTKAAGDPLAALGSAGPPGASPADRKTIITCSGPLEVDYERNVAVFHDDVHVVDQRGEIFADQMTVYIDPKTKQIQKAIAQRHVRIVRADNTAYCDEAIYDPAVGQVTLLGSPRLVVHPQDTGEDDIAPPRLNAEASRATP